MNRIIKFTVALFITFAWISGAGAQDLPSMKTLKSMLLANMYYIQKNPDPGQPASGGSNLPANGWTRGVYFEGLISLYKINPNEAFLNYMLNWGKSQNWSLPGGVNTRDPFNQCCAQTYIDLYLLDRYKEERIKTVRAGIDANMTNGTTDDWNSTDAVQMAMPVYARLGKIYNDEKYFARMQQLYSSAKLKLGLKEPDGWIIAALARSLDFLPDKARYRKDYETTLKEMFESLVPLQRNDGFWNDLPNTALIIYGMAWGINNNLISSKEYLPVVMKAWDAILTESLHTDGSLGYVQVNPGNEDVGVGCFLLAGSEIYKIQKDTEPKIKERKEKTEKTDNGAETGKADRIKTKKVKQN